MIARLGRLSAAIILALLAASSTWPRFAPNMKINRDNSLSLVRLSAGGKVEGAFALAGIWQLTSTDTRFHGYSALLARKDGGLTAISDSGRFLELSSPAGSGAAWHRFGNLNGDEVGILGIDVEAATVDPKGAHLWLAREGSNTIERFDTGSRTSHFVSPPAMTRLKKNGGVEALVRLADGRFIALAEVGTWRTPRRRLGLLFDSDPVAGGKATGFFFRPPVGYDPSDAAALPDGRVVILMRGLSLTGLPPFHSRLVIADPGDIRPGETWPWRDFVDLDRFAPRENYEGLAVEVLRGGYRLWLISDDNRSVFLQRTLLLALDWSGHSAEEGGRSAALSQTGGEPPAVRDQFP